MNRKIPLGLRLKRESHRQIALTQDIIIKEIYKQFNKAVFHGGTAIWRCYAGKRFSEDLDFYIPRETKKIEELFKQFEQKGFKITKKKISETSIYSECEQDRTKVRFEATFQKINGHLVDYENNDGTFTSVYSLTPEEFIKEKINTYLKRRKVRDLYDIFFLTNLVNHPREITKDVQKFLREYQEPLDEPNLRTILIEGLVPSSKDMIDYLKRKWENEST